MKKSIVIIGGHLSPAVAMIEELKHADWSINFVGRKYAFSEAPDKESLEYRTIKNMKIPFKEISAPRFVPESIASALLYPFSMIHSFLTASSYLQSIEPSVVLGFGGYISVPVVLAARWLSIPIVLHDQTLTPGRANVVLSRFADQIMISWKQTIHKYSKSVASKIVLTGNPLRSSMIKDIEEVKISQVEQEVVQMADTADKPLLYITGGSTGAHVINHVVDEALEQLIESYRIIHQCGDSQYDDYTSLVRTRSGLDNDQQKGYLVLKYVSEHCARYIMQNADIIVSRAGINTVIELATLGKPSVLIPHPTVPGQEQHENAKMLVKMGISTIIEQKYLTKDSLIATLKVIYTNLAHYNERAPKIQAKKEIAIHKNATISIAHILEYLVSDLGNGADRS
jgi:UDP-N-acetylglucosamine--N-acetylmuramyl-(pentapeptide) pyrophosphoryl-undecaprenol N-acetylglucosamine transferase